MRRWVKLGAILLVATAALADAATAASEKALDFGIGYRRAELDWNIGGGVLGPNIISELTWSDLEIIELRGKLTFDLANESYLEASLTYGSITDGKNQDSDYDGNDRTLEWSRSENDGDGDDVLDFAAGWGPRLLYPNAATGRTLRVTPLIGFSYHEQNLRMTNGYQTIASPAHVPPTPPVGPFPGLNSTFDAEWWGPWFGIELQAETGTRFTVSGRFEYHLADYYAEANWNLRNDFAHPKSFEHEADGSGYVLSVGARYQTRGTTSLSADFRFEDWSTDPGIIRFFGSDGSVGVQRLNEVNWESWAIKLGLQHCF